MEKPSIKIKIGRFEYDITEDDRFLDNGACVQLLTQSKEKRKRFDREAPSPHLSKQLVAQINKMELIQHKVQTRFTNCKLFSIKIKVDVAQI